MKIDARRKRRGCAAITPGLGERAVRGGVSTFQLPTHNILTFQFQLLILFGIYISGILLSDWERLHDAGLVCDGGSRSGPGRNDEVCKG